MLQMIGQRSSRVSEFERRRLHRPGNILYNDVCTVKIFRISTCLSCFLRNMRANAIVLIPGNLLIPFRSHLRSTIEGARILTHYFFFLFFVFKCERQRRVSNLIFPASKSVFWSLERWVEAAPSWVKASGFRASRISFDRYVNRRDVHRHAQADGKFDTTFPHVFRPRFLFPGPAVFRTGTRLSQREKLLCHRRPCRRRSSLSSSSSST